MMGDQSRSTNYRDVMREQMHRQYAVELRKAGWIVLHESDFTVNSFHTNPYFHAAVTTIARWYEHPTDPPDPEELSRLIETYRKLDPAWDGSQPYGGV